MIFKRRWVFIFLIFIFKLGYSQSFNVEEVTKAKLVNVSGGFSANAIAYYGNATRDPFSYFINGNININIMQLLDLPFSFSYSTQEFGYGKPVAIKTFSIHPSYKWITAHIGEVNMTFSPYTLNGHLFTGMGVDLTPQGKFKISAMYGRLLKSQEYDLNYPEVMPAYERYGYGFKTSYAFEKINLGLIFFKAYDNINSISGAVPFELGLSPKENVAMSFETGFKLFKTFHIKTEYANSSITDDISFTDDTKAKSVASYFLNPNATTTSQNALKLQLSYAIGKGTIGLGYERIDPNYRTLGSYYFNNDLENITINATQSIFKDKITLAVNVGLQKDNLNLEKASQSNRVVSSVSMDYKATKKLSLNFNYSNFQSFTNSRNQFDYINADPNKILDTLNYRQVNQNFGAGANYIIKNDKKLKKSISCNFAAQKSVSLQQEKVTKGGETTFYNSAIAYTQGYPEKDINFTGSLNNSLSFIETSDNFIIGPTIGVTKLFMKKKLNTSFNTGYNTSFTNGDKQNEILNLRLNSSYILLEKHNFSLALVSLFGRSTTAKNNDLTATFSYSYSFDKIKFKSSKNK